MGRQSEPVTTRLDSETLQALDMVRKRFGDSRGEYVRRTLLLHLFHDQQDHLQKELCELRLSSAEVEEHLLVLQGALKKLALVLLTIKESISIEQATGLVQSIFPDSHEQE